MFADSIEIILINLTYDIFGLLVISRHKNIHITVTKKAGYHFFFTFLELEKIVGYIRMPEMRISNHFLKKLGNTSKSCQKCNFTWIFTISVRPYLQKLLRYDMMLRHGNTVYTYIFSNIYWKLCILLKIMYFFTKKMYLFVYHITSFLKKMVGITHFRHSYVLPLFLQALKK